MAGFLSAAISAIGSSGIGSAISRIIIAYGVSRLINGSTGANNQGSKVNEGIRLQLQPDTTNPIPLLYGSAFLSGNITDARLTNNNKTMWVCLTISEHTSRNRLSDNAAVNTNFDKVYINDQEVVFKSDGFTVDYIINEDNTIDTSARDLIKIYLYKKGSAQPTFATGSTAPLNTLNPAWGMFPGWDTNWTMTNLTFALVRIDYNRDKGITSIPTFKFKVSNSLFKPGDALYDYMSNTVSGAGLLTTDIDTTSLTALNSYSAQPINFYDEDTDQTLTLSNRYQINGIINPQNNVLSNMQEIANSCGSYINYDITTGLWGVVVNKSDTVKYNFDDSNIISGIDVTSTSLESMYNSIRLEFPNQMIRDQTDTVVVRLPGEYLNANETENVLSIKMSMLNEPVQARELAYIELYQNRLDRVVTFTTDYSKIQVAAGDIISLSSDIYGFADQTLRVIRVREIEDDLGSLAVEIVAQEYDTTLYSAGGQPRRPRTPSTAASLPSIGIIVTPSAPTVVTSNNTRQPTILVTGVVPTGVVDRFEFWYSTDNWTTSYLLSEEKNTNGSPYNSGTSILYRVTTLPEGNYRFKVRAGNEQNYSNYSDTSNELSWAPVQTTDAVTADTSFSVSDLLPTLGAGAIAYFAYKALYPELLESLSSTALGQLLGIESPSQAALIKEKLEQEARAFKVIVAGDEIMNPETDDSITFTAGDGIEITANTNTHEITISATGGATAAAGFNEIVVNENTTLNSSTTTGQLKLTSGTGIKLTVDTETNEIVIDNTCCDQPAIVTEEIKDQGSPWPKLLDNCQVINYRPAKIKTFTRPAVTGTAESWVKITGAGSWYDPCYRTNVETIVIFDPINALNMKIGQKTTLKGRWRVPYLDTKFITIKKVTENNYVALKNWDSTTGQALPASSDVCDITPIWSRPLFPSLDYPSGYELATYSNLTPVLNAQGSNLNLLYIPAVATVPSYTYNVTYPSRPEITRNARYCVDEVTVARSWKKITITGRIIGDIIYAVEGPVPVGSVITGTYIDDDQIVPIQANTTVTGTAPANRIGSRFYSAARLNKTYTTDVNEYAQPIEMVYYEKSYATIPASDVVGVDYGLMT